MIGEQVAFNKKWGTHTFTEEEIENLLAGRTITFKQRGKNISGKLAWQEYKGRKFLGFLMDHAEKTVENGYVTGTWKGKEVAFKKEWGGHTFTEDEIKALLAWEKITFTAKSKSGKDFEATGTLANQSFRT